MISDERALWQAVLAMAVEDALTGVSASSGTREEKIHQTHHVRLWFTRPNNDFNSVVTMAGLDPQAVRDQMRHK
ncbi:hypothetical protein, partial [Yoonia sp.]|uniref:hypothetical protein n=1 Tax=Yoonia sp. TaxID=2212373 RepID=UPI003919E7EC